MCWPSMCMPFATATPAMLCCWHRSRQLACAPAFHFMPRLDLFRSPPLHWHLISCSVVRLRPPHPCTAFLPGCLVGLGLLTWVLRLGTICVPILRQPHQQVQAVLRDWHGSRLLACAPACTHSTDAWHSSLAVWLASICSCGCKFGCQVCTHFSAAT